MLSFWKWLFREFYGPTVKCIECGMRGVKAEMFYDKDYGYFCTVEGNIPYLQSLAR